MAKDLEGYILELESIAGQLNSDDIKLESAMKLYKKGVESAKQAKQLLDKYEEELIIIEEDKEDGND